MDEYYMRIALALAEKGRGKVSPNPMVGAVIVKENRIIGSGYHMKYGEAHAEVNAFNAVTEDTKGSVLYVTLEPCSHYGKTPPCVDMIIEKGIKRVVIGALDPNPLVAGKGIKKLIDSGIEVRVGTLEKECREINKVFLKYIVEKKPYVILKSAMTLDGKIATASGESKWITSKESRMAGHNLRNKYAAIMVGVNTIIADNPQLTCRIEGGKNPRRIIVDTRLRIPLDAYVVNDEYIYNTVIATTERADKNKLLKLKSRGIEILVCPVKQEKVDLQYLMKVLADLNIDSVLIEGGAELNFSSLQDNIVDEINFFIAPKIIGGVNAKSAIGGEGVQRLIDTFKLENIQISMIEDDICLKGTVKRGEAKCLQE